MNLQKVATWKQLDLCWLSQHKKPKNTRFGLYSHLSNSIMVGINTIAPSPAKNMARMPFLNQPVAMKEPYNKLGCNFRRFSTGVLIINKKNGCVSAPLNRKPISVLHFSCVHQTILSRGGWFGSSIVFQDDAMVMLLYWRKCLLLVGERKFYGHVTMKDYTN